MSAFASVLPGDRTIKVALERGAIGDCSEEKTFDVRKGLCAELQAPTDLT